MILMGGLPLRFGFWWGLCCYLTAGKYPASLSLLRIQHLESGFIVATHNSDGPYAAGAGKGICPFENGKDHAHSTSDL